MQKPILPFLLLVFWTAPLAIFAQALDLGCDGLRYKQNVFTIVKKTTVDYAPTISHTGLGMTLKMDVYEPQGDVVAARPAVVLAHGGSFVFGSRSDMQTWCERLARKGYVAVSIDYRIYPVFTLGFPDSIDIFDTAIKAVGDMKAAVRYLREDAATANQFRVDPSNIYIGGYSAGAVTALHAGYLDENDVLPAFIQNMLTANGGLEGISGTASNKTYSSSSKAVMNMSGGIYRRQWVDNTDLPLVSIHGTADETMPYLSGIAADIAYLEGSGLIHPQAESAGIWSYLETVPGGGHTNIYDQAQFATSLNSFITHATDLLESLTCSSVGTAEPDALASWSLGPNPLAGDWLRIYGPVELGAVDVTVFDQNGKTILSAKNLVAGAAIQAGQLPAGIYTVQISNPANPAATYPARQLVRSR